MSHHTILTSVGGDHNRAEEDDFSVDDWNRFVSYLRSEEAKSVAAAVDVVADATPVKADGSGVLGKAGGPMKARTKLGTSMPWLLSSPSSDDMSSEHADGAAPTATLSQRQNASQSMNNNVSYGGAAAAAATWTGMMASDGKRAPFLASQPHAVQHTHASVGPSAARPCLSPMASHNQSLTSPIISLLPATTGSPLQFGLVADNSIDSAKSRPSLMPRAAGQLSSDSNNSTSHLLGNSQTDAPPAMRLRSFSGAPGLASLPPSSAVFMTPNSSIPTFTTSVVSVPQGAVPALGVAEDPAVQSNLFVCGLASDVDDATLEALFAPYGTIESAKVMLDIRTGRSRCIAFVKYTTVEAAQTAMEALNGVVVHGQCLKVRVANSRAAYLPGNPTNKTFLRNVPLTVTRAELMDYFSAFGEVTDISIHADSASAHGTNAEASLTSLGTDAERSMTSMNALPPSTGSRTAPEETPRLNIVFITFTTKEAAAAAAAATHTKMPFKDCHGIPLLAKVAEDSTRRVQRLARRNQTPSQPSMSSPPVSMNSSRAALLSPGAVSVATSATGGPAGSANASLSPSGHPMAFRVGAAPGAVPAGAPPPPPPPPPYVTQRLVGTPPVDSPQTGIYPPSIAVTPPPPQQQQQQQLITVMMTDGKGQAVPVQVLAPVAQSPLPLPPQTYVNPTMWMYANQAPGFAPSPLPPQQAGGPYYMVPNSMNSPQWSVR